MAQQILTITLCWMFLFSLSSPAYPDTPGSVQVSVKDFYSEALLSGATVTMEPGGYSDITDVTGSVVFTNIIPYRNYAVAVSLAGYIEGVHGEGRTGFVWVKPGETAYATVPIKKESTIQGKVTSSSVPVPDAVVVLTRTPLIPSEDDEEFVGAALTDSSGNYSFPSVAEGNYFVRAFADSHVASSKDPITLGTDALVTKNFPLTPGTGTLSYSILNTRNYYGNSASFRFSLLRNQYKDRALIVTDAPPGAEVLNVSNDGLIFTPTLGGHYTVTAVLTNFNDVVTQESATYEMVNHPTEAFPSIIPGPSELPLLYDGVVYTDSRGTVGVRPGEKVCFRGWGRDFNISSPEQFNPDAPMFDIYGNKNGDWSQSAFSFEWRLRDGLGTDQTGLLSATSTQNVCLTVPTGAQNGDTYIATLTVTGDDDYGPGPYAGSPAEVSVIVADFVGTLSCGTLACHGLEDNYLTYQNTTHYTIGGGDRVACEDCHGPGSEHSSNDGDFPKIARSHWAGVCGQCHDEFAQWQKSRHSDPLAFGHAEISSALIRECYKCHYTEGFIGAVESGEDFSTFAYPMLTMPPEDTPNVSCDVCHDPHEQSLENPAGIRTGSEESVCGTCHEKKWQNAVYTATGDVIENAHHWGNYSQYQGDGNPHKMAKGCVSCHMAPDLTDTDAYGVRKVGGHSLRMRDFGVDGDPGTPDDLLNIPVCEECHPGLTTFDLNGFTSGIKAKLDTLGNYLREKNNGFLPPFQPGKCATCHRGGTLPFINETNSQSLEKAYLNYKLILHDRSFGIHNPGYVERLLDDSISVFVCEGDFDCNRAVDANDVGAFLADFGRNPYNDPCAQGNQCNGDFDCDGSVAANDVSVFLADFGRNQFNNPCPACEVDDWCNYQ